MEGGSPAQGGAGAPRLAVIGAGGMGRLIAGLLAPDAASITLVDPRFEQGRDAVDLALAAVLRALRFGETGWSLEPELDGLRRGQKRVPVACVVPPESELALSGAEVVVLCLPYTGERQFAALVEPYVPALAPGALVADTASLKAGPLRVLEKLVPSQCDVLGTHPIFGPGISDVAGQVVAIVAPPSGRHQSPWRSWLVETLVRRKLLVTPCDAEEHDRAMTHVQVLTHFVLLALARCIVRGNVEPADLLPFRSPVFEPLVYLAARVAILAWDSPDTYAAIQRQAGSDDIRRAFLEAAEELRGRVEGTASGGGAQRDSLEDLLVRTGAYWGHVPTALKADPRARVGADLLTELERRSSEPFRRANVLAVSNSATAELARVRREVIDSAGRVRALRDTSTGVTHVGLIYLDPDRHDKVDLSTRVRFRRVNLPTGTVYDAGRAWPGEQETAERLAQVEAALASVPLLHARFLADEELFAWLDGALDDPRVSAALNRYAIRSTPALSLRAPPWFDEEIVNRLIGGFTGAGGGSRVWRVRFGWLEEPRDGLRAAQLFLHCFVHPEALVAMRASEVRRIATAGGERAHDAPPLHWAFSSVPIRREQQVEADRLVRRRARDCVAALVDGVRAWLLAHGCEPR